MSVRVRFAPSPTGYLHIGGARTALFNWLFVRNKNGKFILRIEDTDITRNREECIRAIIQDLKWLGLDWDEGPEMGGDSGPYYQSQRMDKYKMTLEILEKKSYVYKCYCTSEELEERRMSALNQHQTPGYDGRCRNLTQDEEEKFRKEGKVPVLRFKVPDTGETKFYDLIRGEVSFENKLLGDFIIQKSDGMPTFLFANIVDDVGMSITHIIRGEDHISNTPRQILISRALGAQDRTYAHLPLIFGKSGGPLSKRDGAVSLGWYRDGGFLPEALMNYLVLLGWAPDGVRQILAKEEMIKEFKIERISKNPAIFDMDKLIWINSEYMKKIDLDKKTDMVIEYLISKNIVESSGRDFSAIEKDKIKEIVRVLGDRLKVIPDIETYGLFFFTDDLKYDEQELSGKLSDEKVRKSLVTLREKFSEIPFDHANIEQAVRSVTEEMGLKAKDVIHPLRYVLTAKTVGPGLFETIALLGREKTIERLQIVH